MKYFYHVAYESIEKKNIFINTSKKVYIKLNLIMFIYFQCKDILCLMKIPVHMPCV